MANVTIRNRTRTLPPVSPSNDSKRRELLAAWDTAARLWASEQALQAVAAAGTHLTTAQVLDYIDRQTAPAGYEILKADYARRYHFVRRSLMSLVKSDSLVEVAAVNSRKRPCGAYGAPAERPAVARRRKVARGSYDVVVEGSPEWAGRLEDFMRGVPDGAISGVLITKKE